MTGRVGGGAGASEGERTGGGGASKRHQRPRMILAIAAITAGIAGILLWRLAPLGPRSLAPVPPGTATGAAVPPPAAAQFRGTFTDVTEGAGIRFRHESGARGKMLNPETFGPGAGWVDADGDGRPDLLLINGNVLEGESDPAAVSRLYRNRGDGSFEDVTERAGIGVPFYAMGFAAADVDGDADQDLLIYGLRRSVLFLNDGTVHFRDATAASGLESLRGWVACAAFFDYDRDGRLDLFAGNYVDWTLARDQASDCSFGTARRKYCPVAIFPPSGPQLFRGRGDGTFEERTGPAGLGGLRGKALGVAVEDYDRDGFPDLFVANDSVPNFLLRNRGDGAFEERGLESGFALDPGGAALAGMGIDTSWSPGGQLCVAVGNFSGEPVTLHVQEGRDFFTERSMAAGIGRATIDRVTFGLLFEDFDLDGLPDIFLANGHVFDLEELGGAPYRQRAQLFLAQGTVSGTGTAAGTFAPASGGAPGSFLDRPVLGRAAAAADFDGDGDLDLVVTENQGRVYLLRNDQDGARRFVKIDLRGTRSNRDAIGAEVTLRLRGSAGEQLVRRTRKSASSYLSQSDRRIIVGLALEEEPISAEVAWPSGLRELFAPVPVGREILWTEGQGQPVSAPPSVPPAPAARNPVEARRLGIESLKAGRPAEALRAFEEAIRSDPDDLVAERGRLAVLQGLGRSAEVEARLREAFARHADPHLLLSAFAAPLREEGRPELAARFFEEAVRLDPKRVDAWIALGNLAFDRRAAGEALRAYGRALELQPDSLEALTNSAKIRAMRKEHALAVPLLERALALRPTSAPALSALGGILIETGDLPRAQELLERALASATAKETILSIHGNLGILHLRKREKEKAREHFEKVLELDPSDARAKEVLDRLEGRSRKSE